jgi:Domain of unknown function (DUF4404)
VQSTIDKIEEKIRTNSTLTETNKRELLDLLSLLKPDMEILAKAKTEEAESIVGFIERSVHEISRRDKNPTLLKYAVDGLLASVIGFETSHPKLVENVNYIANSLANMGI